VTWLFALITAVLGFIFGRIFHQSEQILTDKRRVYEEFLRHCPQPNDALADNLAVTLQSRSLKLEELKGPLMIYASASVMQSLSQYLDALAKLNTEQVGGATISNAQLQYAAKAQNNVIIEMRRDVLAWSVFAHAGKARELEPPSD
jgi:hypothetical protein